MYWASRRWKYTPPPKELETDLIVVGSHGRYGLALLMGSTANGVLHGATCDVLAVRVGKHELTASCSWRIRSAEFL